MLNENTLKEYKERLLTQKKKDRRFFLIIMFLCFSTAIPFIILYSRGPGYVAIFWTSFGLGLLFLLLTLLIFANYSNPKLIYEYLFPKIIDTINSETKYNITYEIKPEKTKDKVYSKFVYDSGLWLKATNVVTDFKLRYDSAGLPLVFTKVNVESINPKPEQRIRYFDGFYMVFQSKNSMYFRLKSKGKSRHKNVEMKKIQTRDDVNEYVYESGIDRIDNRYYEVYDFVRSKGNDTYISGIPGEIHVGLDGIKFPVISEKDLSLDTLQELKQMILEYISLSNEIANMIR